MAELLARAPLAPAEPTRPAAGWYAPGPAAPATDAGAMRELLADVASPVAVVRTPRGVAVAGGGTAQIGGACPPGSLPLLAYAPALRPQDLGDPAFRATYSLRYAHMTGAMANGIASVRIVEAMGNAGMLGSFGAAGLSLARVEEAIRQTRTALGDGPACFNLIHSPNEPAHEMAVAELYLRHRVRIVEASAYLALTPAIVFYRVSGLSRGPNGSVSIANRVIAKVSRTEVATPFLSAPPARIVQDLLRQGRVTAEQAELAAQVPMCDDLTAEADSGGHTDNRPAITLLPTLLALRDRLQSERPFAVPVRVGLAGGLATPAGMAAAFSMGAAYVVTGSINQACVESGSSDAVRKILAEAGQADVAMAPAADMFEMGVKVQVLKRGTMFAMRGGRLYEIYRQFGSWEAVPEAERVQVEKTILRRSFGEVWAETAEFFAKRDPAQVAKAESDARHKMALVFRWYLGLSSRWANAGEPSRQLDYQVWCGPSMGAFNEWTKATALERPENRAVVPVALNLLYGACVHLRRQSLAQQGVGLPDAAFDARPLGADDLARRLG